MGGNEVGSPPDETPEAKAEKMKAEKAKAEMDKAKEKAKEQAKENAYVMEKYLSKKNPLSDEEAF